MHFILCDGPEKGISELTSRLGKELELGHQVLWLLSGGSNIEAGQKIISQLSDSNDHLLTIMLNDERYDEDFTHGDSNWHKLMRGGHFDQRGIQEATLRPGLSFEDTVSYFEIAARESFDHKDSAISLLGMGADGHVAGILPNSPATEETDRFVVGYRGPDFRRITLSFGALRHVNAVYLFAFGEAKKPALENLRDKALSLKDQPAQVLWELPEVYVYNDQIGDPA